LVGRSWKGAAVCDPAREKKGWKEKGLTSQKKRRGDQQTDQDSKREKSETRQTKRRLGENEKIYFRGLAKKGREGGGRKTTMKGGKCQAGGKEKGRRGGKRLGGRAEKNKKKLVHLKFSTKKKGNNPDQTGGKSKGTGKGQQKEKGVIKKEKKPKEGLPAKRKRNRLALTGKPVVKEGGGRIKKNTGEKEKAQRKKGGEKSHQGRAKEKNVIKSGGRRV